MFSQKHAYFIIGFTLFFSGCTFTNTTTKAPIIIEEPTPLINKTKIVKPIKKKIFTYKFCREHAKIMTHASSYIKEEFNKGYFIQKDLIGAKAQLFLIESNSNSLFSKNINNAMKSYNSQYKLAKKNKCNLKKFRVSPLKKVKYQIKVLEQNAKK
jgi:hypothetical protein